MKNGLALVLRPWVLLPLLLAFSGLPTAQAADAEMEDMPLSKDDLFGLGEAETAETAETPTRPADETRLVAPANGAMVGAVDEASAGSTDSTRESDDSLAALFGEMPAAESRPRQAAQTEPGLRWHGFAQGEAAYTYGKPGHWSKTLGRLELGTQGRLRPGVQYKLSGRLDYNPVYDLNDYYQSRVARDQRAEFHIRETYLDFTAADLDWRVGRQHVVWGEMVGLFFADVVSAKDMREFVLPDFQTLRIPQWAARAEYFKDDFHAEVVWIPFPSYDEIGKAQWPGDGHGADFYPYPLDPRQYPARIMNDRKPATRFEHGNFGLRLSQLSKGWDVSGFYYTSMDSAPTFYWTGPFSITPKHERIHQLGGTLAKDFRDFVLKAEAVYTKGRRYNLSSVNPAAPGADRGVVRQNTLDWALGLDFNPAADTRVNTQLFQRYFFDHDSHIIPRRAESGTSLLVNHKFSNSWQAEALLVHSLNRRDWMLRPKAIWNFQPDWRATFGLDVFYGPTTGLFGRFDRNDRVYAELRYDF